ASLVFMVIQTSIRNFKVDGSSMDPTLEHGQFLMVNKLVYLQLDMDRLSRIVPFWQVDKSSNRFPIHPPQRREIIVFHFPRDTSKDFVKRVIGLPGEKVELRDGLVFINDRLLQESYITTPYDSTMAPLILDNDEYFVMGDNRRSSNDSRMWGPVPESHLLGKVWFVYWPFSGLQVLNALPWGATQTLR
ncbi:MAG: signal peptidase I, partial [Chloroflexi bacterium]|nr:signal peptidase I [Chloroflexota bacterium]